MNVGRFATLAVVTWLLSSGVSSAACGRYKVPTYSDIDSVSFQSTGCFGHCSTYRVLIDSYELRYLGYKWVSMTGTYVAPPGKILSRAKTVLAEHNFYSLNYDNSVFITDVPHLIISASRCGVMTTLEWPYFFERGNRPDILSLFQALNALTDGVKWKKVSDAAQVP